MACDKKDTPISEVDSDSLLEWIDSQKPWLKVVETDVRDAKRRISAAKGPRKKQANTGEDEDPASGAATEDDLQSEADD